MQIKRRLYWSNASKSFTGWDSELKQTIEINPATLRDIIVVDVLDQLRWFSSIHNMTAYSKEQHWFKKEFDVNTVKGDFIWRWLYNKETKKDLSSMWISLWKGIAVLEQGEVNIYYVKWNAYMELVNALDSLNIKSSKISFKELRDWSKGTAKWSSPIWEKGEDLSDGDRDNIAKLSESDDNLPN